MTGAVNPAAINPDHYRRTPRGIDLECINYVRHLPFSQGNAAKYIYRAGNKGDRAEDYAKAAWYLQDAGLVPAVNLELARPDLWATIHPAESFRARLFAWTVAGDFRWALGTLAAMT